MGDNGKRNSRNTLYRLIGQIVSFAVTVAVIFLIGIAIAANINHTTFTIEWENMVIWFQTWAK